MRKDSQHKEHRAIWIDNIKERKPDWLHNAVLREQHRYDGAINEDNKVDNPDISTK